MSLKRILLSFVLVLISVFCVLFVTFKPQAKAQEPGLIFYESFDDQSSIAANGGTINGTESFVPGKVGNAIDLATATVTYPREGNYNIDEGRMEFWVKPRLNDLGQISQIQQGGLFDVGTLSSDSDILFINYDKGWIEYNGQAAVSMIPISVDGWYQFKVAWRCSKSSTLPDFQSISINGQTSFRETGGNCLTPKTTDLLTFGWSRAYLWSGAIFDEVKIYGTFTDPPTFTKPQSTGSVRIESGKLKVNGLPFVARGVGYQPIPIGGLEGEVWKANCDGAVYNRDMPLLSQMGANTIRTWQKVDHGCAAGYTGLLDAANQKGIKVLMGYWVNWPTDYANVTQRQNIKNDFKNYVARYKNHPGVLAWAIANENNYHTSNYKDMYSLFGEMAQEAYLEEGATYHPVVIVNGDLKQIGIPQYNSDDASLPYVDIWGTNIYTGQSFGNTFANFRRFSLKPLFITEFGVDALDDRNCTLQEQTQADWAVSLFSEIFANPNIAVGGTLMAYSDEWWKANRNSSRCPIPLTSVHGSTIHDYGGFSPGPFDDSYFNEEWWGIFSVTDNGLNPDILTPRLAYSSLKNLFDPDSDGDGFRDSIENYVGTNQNVVCSSATVDGWPPDVDMDKVVSILDLTKMAQAFGAKTGDAKYNKRFDLDADGSISILDLTHAAQYFTSRCEDPVKNSS